MTINATPADRTEPKEKKTERAVTRYCFPLGICSRRRVPSVGIEPPTALPRKNSRIHNDENDHANDERIPNNAVKKSVALNAVLRPRRSEQVPQPTAPNIMPANMDDERVPM
jgi:hypothetical protein